MKNLWISMCWLGVVQIAFAQTHQEKLQRELAFEKKSESNTLMVANINGSVEVKAYGGDKIRVEVEKIIMAKTESRLEKGKQELALGIIDLADTLILYVDGLCNKFTRNSGRSGTRTKRSNSWGYHGWGYQWEDCDEDKSWRKDEGYEYRFNFIINVPAGINLSISTINNGDISVTDVTGVVKANHVNGSIRLNNMAGATVARTVNGDVELNYIRNPRADCQYYTLNGNIHANFKKGLTAELSFESFNGSFYTNINQLEALPTSLVKVEDGKGLKYKLGNNRYKIGAGGVHLDFETFNGNVYLKEI